ncbi:MAG: HupE/UreJ family protein [Bacteroidota bacterium]
MSGFSLYLRLGFEHITDPGGWDHMLFLLALCSGYSLRDLRRVLVLVTAFTVGHSLTLALSVLAQPLLPSAWVETLIPVTILVVALLNLVLPPRKASGLGLRYGPALLFGLIHGMGFSNYLRALLGAEESLWEPLLAFNLGLEIGQILVVGAILLLAGLVVDLIRLPQLWWTRGLSLLAVGGSMWLLLGE